MTDQEKTEQVRDYIAQTTGSDNCYKGGFPPITYTDGVRFVAEVCGAHWLIDLVASWQPEIFKKYHRNLAAVQHFQVWQLSKETDRQNGQPCWVARCWSDTPGASTRLVYQKIPYSDFPEGLLPFDLWVESGVLILPAEH